MEREFKLSLEGLDCANCANKIEAKVNKINGIKNASLNFSTTVLTVEINKEEEKNNITNEIKAIVKKLEPHVKVSEKADNKDIDIALVCYEKPGDFCHRHLVADWLNETK